MPDDRTEQVTAALKQVVDPDRQRDLVGAKMVRDITIDGTAINLTIALSSPDSPHRGQIEHEVRTALGHLAWPTDIEFSWTAEVSANTGFGQEGQPIPGVKNTIAIASGKGGVGKSTVAANLTVALRELGTKVGLLDGDIYGPNIPGMLGVNGRPVMENDKIQPLSAFGVPVMSMGFLTDPGQAIIWRGPMIAQALRQLVHDVAWGELDYLVVDLPPGTGDAPLSLSQLLPLSGAVIVSTPQEVALQDVRRGIAMFETLRVPIIGVIENMSYFVSPSTGERFEIFDHGGAKRAAEELGVPFLGEIPLDPEIRIAADNGRPVTSRGKDDPIARPYYEAASRIGSEVARLNAAKPDPLPVL
jgi:ATP-binding protein involved in chromosome partitioning